MNWQVETADVMEWAAEYTGPMFHALLCDPPYELGFMGKNWDKSGIAFKAETWAALAEHLLPGAFGMAFASSRGWHRLAVAIEDAGLRIHPSIFGWCYGSGFPKATRIDTQVDKAAGAERETIGEYDSRSKYDGCQRNSAGVYTGGITNEKTFGAKCSTVPATPLAQSWQGHRYGLQALKPALEPIIVFQKPYAGKPVDSITASGAGALNIEQSRIGTDTSRGDRYNGKAPGGAQASVCQGKWDEPWQVPQGRWPANFTLIHSPLDDDNGCHESCPVRRLGEQSGESKAGIAIKRNKNNAQFEQNEIYNKYRQLPSDDMTYGDKGTAARFFFQSDWSYEIAEQLAQADPVRYVAKASRKERDAGLEHLSDSIPHAAYGEYKGTPEHVTNMRGKQRNPHPTIKPIALTRWLATLLLPPAEYAPRRVLIPFCGTMSEGIGAALAGWEYILGIEMDTDTVAIAEPRMRHWLRTQDLGIIETT